MPTGTVDFFDATTNADLGTANLSGGVAVLSTSALAVGLNAVAARYSGDAAFQSSVTVAGPNSTIITVAGNGILGYSGDNGPANLAKLADPSGIAVDGSNHLFIADTDNNCVREVDLSTGVITTVAGNGIAGWSGDGGPATAASLDGPTDLAVDDSGHLFIADERNNCIREVDLSTGKITWVAGSGFPGFGGNGGPATAAEFACPAGMAVDESGHLFIADQCNSRIREIDLSTGIITTVAGSGVVGYSGDGFAATAASLNYPPSVAVDDSGHLFIADIGNGVVREVNLATGVITTAAGSGTAGPSDDGDLATGVNVDANGNLVIADTGHNAVRQINLQGGVIVTIAGGRGLGYGGDGGPASAAVLNGPSALALDAAGDIFVADSGNARIREIVGGALLFVFPRRISPRVTVADAGGTFNGGAFPATALVSGVVLGLDTTSAPSLEGVSPTFTYYAGTSASGPGTANAPVAAGTYTVVALFPGSTFYAAAQSSPVTFTIARLTPIVSASRSGGEYNGAPFAATATVAGWTGGDIAPPAATLEGVAPTITYYDDCQTTQGGSSTPPTDVGFYTAVATFPGSTDYTSAESDPVCFEIAPAGPAATYITLTASNTQHFVNGPVTITALVGVLSPYTGMPSGGTVTFEDGATVLAVVSLADGTASFTTSSLAPGNHWLDAQYSGDDSGNFAASDTQTSPWGPYSNIVTVAGNFYSGSGGDGGLAVDASVSPGLATPASDGRRLFFSDSEVTPQGQPQCSRVREVDLATGIITTVAGIGLPGYSGDGGPATSAMLNGPQSVAVDTAGQYLYIADYSNNRIRRVDLSTGVITTVAGDGTAGYSGDDGPATAAEMHGPSALALDGAGHLFFSDELNNSIREVDLSTGIITTVAGAGNSAYTGNGVQVNSGFSGDGGPATDAELGGQWMNGDYAGVTSIAADASGRLFIADSVNNRVRLVNLSGADMTLAGVGTLHPGDITTIVGDGECGVFGDGGPGALAKVNPRGVALDSTGRYLYIDDYYGNRVRRWDSQSGLITALAGSGESNVVVPSARIVSPMGLSADATGRLFVSNGYGNVLEIANGADYGRETVHGHPNLAGRLSQPRP